MHWTVAAWTMEVQFEHDTTVEFNEYFPAIQLVQFVAPGLVPVFVMEQLAATPNPPNNNNRHNCIGNDECLKRKLDFRLMSIGGGLRWGGGAIGSDNTAETIRASVSAVKSIAKLLKETLLCCFIAFSCFFNFSLRTFRR